MSRSIKAASLILVCLVSFSACAGTYSGNGVSGGVIGGASGAALGALVGNVITNGNPATSALLGAGLGVPLGVVLGLAFSAYDEDLQDDRRFAEYLRRQKEIMRTDLKIERLRDELRDSYPSGNPKRILKKRYHSGPTLGSYFR